MAETATTASLPSTAPSAPRAPAVFPFGDSAPAAPAQPAARPGAIPDNQYDRLTPEQQSTYARVRKGPDGGGEWVARDSLPAESADPAKPATANTNASVTEDGRLKVGEMLLSDQDIRGLMERHALEQGRKATMPATAADYRLDLPSDFVMPEGQSFKFSTDHPVLGPIIGQAKELAHSLGMDQVGFSKMMSLYAATQVHEAQMISKAQAAEREKLGPMIAHRVDAITQYIRGSVGDDKVAKGMTQRILTADDVVGWERIISKATRQGAASFRQDGREPAGQPGRVSEEQWSGMSSAEKWDYARGYDQRQFKSNGGG
jgi:hypothetical protein